MKGWWSAVLLAPFLMSPSRSAWCDSPWVAASHPGWTEARSDEYAWRLFVAINRPAAAGAQRAAPDAPFGDSHPAVWESWKSLAEVFLSDGRDPGPWLRGSADSPLRSEARFETLSPTQFPNARHVVDGKMAPLADPLAHAKRLTETHMNEVAYTYIRDHDLYNVEGQLNAVRSGHEVQFPPGAINVKAKWRPIEAVDAARYHTSMVRFADGSSHLYGLTALHLASKALPNWFWATFEHIDNAAASDGEGWLLASRDAFACRGRPLSCNRAPTGVGLEGTVWKNYRLRGTLTRAVDQHRRPFLLANSELEAGDQRHSSCITCHSRSALASSAGAPVRLSIFEGSDDDAVTGMHEGAIGEPHAEWFMSAGGDARERFHQLDFVWSLSKAQTRRGS